MSTEVQVSGPTVQDYVSVIKRRGLAVLIPLVGFTALAVAVGFLVPQEYEATTQLVIEDPEVVSGFYKDLGFPIPHKQLLVTVSEDIKSQAFLEPIIDRFDINEGYNRNNPREKLRLIEQVRKKLTVKIGAPQKTGPDLLVLQYQGRDAEKVTRFVNQVSASYQDLFMGRYQDLIRKAYGSVKGMTVAAQTAYTTAQTNLEEWLNVNGGGFAANDPTSGIMATLGKQKESQDALQTQLRGDQDALKNVIEQLKSTPEVSAATTTKKINPDYAAQQAKVQAADAAVKDFIAKGFLETWPPFKDAKAILEAEQAKLGKIEQLVLQDIAETKNPAWIALENQRRALQSSIESTTSKLTRLNDSITQLETEMKTLPQKQRRFTELNDDLNNSRFQFEKTTKVMANAQATMDRVTRKEGSIFRPLASITPDEAKDMDPVFPSIPIFLGVGAFIGLMVGAALAFISEFTSVSFTSPNQVRYSLPVPVLGEVSPLLSRRELRKIRLRRLIVWSLVLGFFAALLVIHLMYFNKDLKGNLPRWLLDFMKRVWGNR